MVLAEVRMNEEEARELLFGNLKEAANSEMPPLPADKQWCELSERRLLEKITEFKPAGVARRLHLSIIVNFMNNIYEDEDGGIQDYLNEKDKALYISRLSRRSHENESIVAHLETFWSMSEVEENEWTPDELLTQADFQLPEELKEKEKDKEISKEKEKSDKEKEKDAPVTQPSLPPPSTSTPTLRAPKQSTAASGSQQRKRRSNAKNKTGDTPDSSRSSTPSQPVSKRLRGD